ncbi:ABC transporter ATP-binding protein [[Clostridium] polysaccharolyticum]|uniref:Putative ABC transport system ATP-binding protein n=1 Tax=[Clostridium] polysaccharolyticum TaxID=29364 RepID=A0A1I0AFI5_9FIRM|nr:ABC transporter ATP-binding protein [[Clostridium] polysaccharolyticum]SES92987.1 putative ABC transport system ATP-binding protein [[Clostridium] polysaccharolyticum]
MLVAENLKKIFHEGVDVEVLDGVNLTVQKGDFIVVTGKSGSGKSTLLYVLSGLEQPSEGRVLFHGKNIHKLKDKQMSRLRRESFGFVFQFYNLIPTISVRDNIMLPLEFHNSVNKGKREKVDSLMELLGLQEKGNVMPYKLSGGQQQRVAIARALAIEPELIFADEPTGNLDASTSEEVMGIFQKLNKEMNQTIIMVTHDQTVGERYATREIVVRNKKILEL